jgi:hypothetical protein
VVAIQWPINTAPGLRTQDGAGRLINVYPETRENGVGTVWRRAPGATFFTSISASTSAMTGTITATFVGVNPQGAAAMTGTATLSLVGST